MIKLSFRKGDRSGETQVYRIWKTAEWSIVKKQ